MSKKIDHYKYCDEIMKNFIHDYQDAVMECDWCKDYKLLRVEKMCDYGYKLFFDNAPDGFSFNMDIFPKGYNSSKYVKAYEMQVYFYVCYEPFADKTTYSYSSHFLKFDCTYKYYIDGDGKLTKSALSVGGNGYPSSVSSLLDIVYNTPHIAAYLQYYADSYPRPEYFKTERQVKRFVNGLLKEKKYVAWLEDRCDKKSVNHAVKFFEKMVEYIKKNPNEYVDSDEKLDWSGIENLRVEVLDNGLNTSPRYDILLVSDTYAKNVEATEKSTNCGSLFESMWDEYRSSYQKFYERLDKKYGNKVIIDSHYWAEIVTEEKFERMKKFAEKERNYKPQPEEVFAEWN